MKPILLMFPSGAGGDFIAGLYLLYNYNKGLVIDINSQWKSSNDLDITKRIEEYHPALASTVKIVTGHWPDRVIHAHYTNHIRTQIIVEHEWVNHVATAYVLKNEMIGADTGNGSERISTANVIIQSQVMQGFAVYKYSELFDNTHSTIPHLLASWGTIVPDQEVLQHLVQYYNKCNKDLFNGIRTTPITFKYPEHIMTELRKVGYV